MKNCLLFVLLAMTLLPSCRKNDVSMVRQEPRIETGDLLFVGIPMNYGEEDMAQAIADATSDGGDINFIHTAILEVDETGKEWVIDATIAYGVDRHPLDTLLSQFTSGDDVARPVLGYSLSGSFRTDEPLPVNFRDMLDWYAAEIKLAREKGWEPSPSVHVEWNNPTKAGSSGRVQLTTAAWNQFAPYNNLCPKVDGEECPCGCVATAMAIIMRYHKWPDHGTGTLPGYDFYWDGTKYRYHIDGHDLGGGVAFSQGLSAF